MNQWQPKSKKVARFLLGMTKVTGLFSPLVTGPAAKWLKSAPLFRLNGITFRGFRIKR